jgi:hypothetical protein
MGNLLRTSLRCPVLRETGLSPCGYHPGPGDQPTRRSSASFTVRRSSPSYHDPEQLVMVWSKPRPDSRNSRPQYSTGRRKAPSSRACTPDRPQRQPRDGQRPARAVPGRAGHAGLDRELGLHLQLGATSTRGGADRQDDKISASLWQRGSAAIPRSWTTGSLDGKPHTVVGCCGVGRRSGRTGSAARVHAEQVNHDFHWLTVMGRETGRTSTGERRDGGSRAGSPRRSASKRGGISAEPLQNNFFPRNTILGLGSARRGEPPLTPAPTWPTAPRRAQQQREVAVARHQASPDRSPCSWSRAWCRRAGDPAPPWPQLMRAILAVMPAFTPPSESTRGRAFRCCSSPSPRASSRGSLRVRPGTAGDAARPQRDSQGGWPPRSAAGAGCNGCWWWRSSRSRSRFWPGAASPSTA